MTPIRAMTLMMVAALSACASLPGTEKSQTTPETPVVASTNNAVIALAQDARADVSAGRLDVAAANLERALRIEPRNPTLWHELARVSLHRGNAAQAAQFAAKSNTFAADDVRLRAANWRLIGQARTQNGDQTGAEAAFTKAAQLEGRR